MRDHLKDGYGPYAVKNVKHTEKVTKPNKIKTVEKVLLITKEQ